ncbi:MAG: bifunctional 5,10-methylenetetrahydrofolate dehydrogenase/5,10-methenyltetrahydrofolate cyclohydrolase [Candidatus Omnitrophica bacterium]|nr:bifunctional 5,10-methylenetetrahydrofolate dehydrogenase/5,10-methenyltetrahydrofolate cyclohydrolase [Candidatus Omnitrophota bacterium]
MGQLLAGAPLAAKIHDEVITLVTAMKKRYGRGPVFCVAQVGDSKEASLYVEFQKKIAAKLGIECIVRTLPEMVKQEEVIAEIHALNNDASINGIILQLPLPVHLNTARIQANIAPHKDVEGIHPENLGRIILKNAGFTPCTACAVMELLQQTGVAFSGKEAVIVGHSGIVGKPLALMLLDKLSTVTVCHIGTTQAGNLEKHVRSAEILVVAVGKPNLIKGEWIKPGAIVVDVGITCIGGKVAGDVEFEAAAKRAAFITPVPGGVGPVTVAILMRNVAQAARLQCSKEKQ